MAFSLRGDGEAVKVPTEPSQTEQLLMEQNRELMRRLVQVEEQVKSLGVSVERDNQRLLSGSDTQCSCNISADTFNSVSEYVFTEHPLKIFVTSSIHNGTGFGGVAGADQICQTLAESAGLSGKYLAWLANEGGVSPATNFFHSPGPYVTVTGIEIARNWDHLMNTQYGENLYAPMSVDENGNDLRNSPNKGVWTGTNLDGTPYVQGPARDCNDWTNSTQESHMGNLASSTGSQWVGVSYHHCNLAGHFYCFQQP